MKRVLYIMLTCAILSLFTGCSCAKQQESSAADLQIAGSYEITAMTADGKDTAPEDIELLKSKGLNCTITLEEDGTGVLNLFGEKTDITWDDKNITAGETARAYTYQDQKITLTDGDSSLTFSLVEN